MKKFYEKSVIQVRFDEHVQQIVAVKPSDKSAGVVVVCNICRVLGKNIADYLVYRVVALFLKCVINCGKDLFHFGFLVIFYGKLHSYVVQRKNLLGKKLK